MQYQLFSQPAAATSIAAAEDEPLYVNAKQYHRILKRRAARAKFDAELKAARAKKVNTLIDEMKQSNVPFIIALST